MSEREIAESFSRIYETLESLKEEVRILRERCDDINPKHEVTDLNQIKSTLASDKIGETIRMLSAWLDTWKPPMEEQLDTLILISGDHSSFEDSCLKNLLDNEQQHLRKSQIRLRLLTLVNQCKFIAERTQEERTSPFPTFNSTITPPARLLQPQKKTGEGR